MSTIDQERGIRLAPLVETAPDVDKRNQILALAASGKISLFVQVKPGYVAYADKTPRIATSPVGSDIRRSVSLQTQRAIDEDRRRGLPVIVFPERRADVAFLALEPAHAQVLLTAQSVQVHWFPSGLMLVGEFLVPLSLPSRLCLRPYGDRGSPGPWRNAPSEHTFKFEWSDVLLDDRVPSRLEELANAPSPTAVTLPGPATEGAGGVLTPRWSGLATAGSSFDIPDDDLSLLSPTVTINDPFGLRERAPGVFVLYAAAKEFYEKPRAVPVENNDVIDWLASSKEKDLEKLFNAENARQACKFINPKHDKSQSDKNTWAEKPFRPDVLAHASKKYRQPLYSSYVSHYLAVIIHAADEFHASVRWKELAAEPKPKQLKYAKEMLDIIGRFEAVLLEWKFSGKTELRAAVDIVIWDQRIVDLNETLRNR
jgi:hypothetical protein